MLCYTLRTVANMLYITEIQAVSIGNKNQQDYPM